MKRRKQCLVTRTVSIGVNFFERGCGGRIEACSDGELKFKCEKHHHTQHFLVPCFISIQKRSTILEIFCTISSDDD